MNYTNIHTQNDLLLKTLMEFYKNKTNLDKMTYIINGESRISLRIVDWFVTNYAKKNYTVYLVNNERFKVYNDYKLKLKAYSKKKLDPFCRRDRIFIPYNETTFIETTIGQLNFFKWAIENYIIEYIEENYDLIEKDMNSRNSSSLKNKEKTDNAITCKKRKELSVFACKCIKKEAVNVVVKFT
jgi:hypothetical protein